MAHLCLFRSNAMHSISTAKIQNPVGYICDYKMYMYTYVVCASVFFFRSLLLVIRKWKYHRKPVVTTKYDFHWRTRFFFLRHISFWTSTKKIYCAYDIMYVIFMISYALRFLHLFHFLLYLLFTSTRVFRPFFLSIPMSPWWPSWCAHYTWNAYVYNLQTQHSLCMNIEYI